MVFAGIDWSDDHHDAVVVDGDGIEVTRCRVAHTAQGLEELTGRLRTLVASPDQVACVVELRHGLLVHRLLEAGFTVYPVNPKTVDRHRRPSRAKTDFIDAAILARHGLHYHAELRRLEPDAPAIQLLRTLVRDQHRLVQQQTRVLNQLSACLKAYYPLALQCFSKLNQPTALAFLQAYPSLATLQRASTTDIAKVLRASGHPRAVPAAAHIDRLRSTAQLEPDRITVQAKARLMRVLVRQLAVLVEELSAYDREIQTVFIQHRDHAIFESLPGAGRRLAPHLLAEWGDDRERYGSHEAVAALAGTSAVPWQSGRYSRARKRSACIKPFRHTLYMFAWLSTFLSMRKIIRRLNNV